LLTVTVNEKPADELAQDASFVLGIIART
jgi:hypothetical protein